MTTLQFRDVGLVGTDGVTMVTVDTVDGVITRILHDRSAPERFGHQAVRSTRWTSGFVDIHSHGGGGHSYDDAETEALDSAVAVHRSHGTRHALLSLVSARPADLAARMNTLRDWINATPGIHGVHLEGPFLAHGRRGAHAPTALSAPQPADIDALLEAGQGILRQVTIAPELPGAIEAIDRLVAAGVIVAVGHTEATTGVAAEAFDHGASLLTHAYNAMPAMLHRDPGPLGAALDRSHVTIEVIADGTHVHPVVIRALFASAPGRVALVSDAMAATGLGDGAYNLGGLSVDVRDGIPTLAGTSVLAGSTLTLDRAVEVAVDAGVPVDDAIGAATVTPATALRIPYSSITVGTALADIVVVDADGRRVLRHASTLW